MSTISYINNTPSVDINGLNLNWVIMMNIHIGKNIKTLRIAKKMTQSELADRIGITKATISAYENSTRLPSYDVLMMLARLFRVTTDNLLGFSDKYSVDVSALNNRQRNIVQEIISLYEFQNEKIQEVLGSNNINSDIITMTYANKLDIEEYEKKKKE